MKRITNILFFLIFFSMLLLPALCINTEEGAVSDVDGRVFVSKPSFGSDGYTLGIETWVKDRLGFGDNIVIAYEVANDVLFNELINPIYQYGKEGYTFTKIHNNIEYSDYHRQFADFVADMQEYCESRGSHFYYVFNPEKESIYRGYLPAGVNYDDSWADSMLSYMDSLGVNYIDLRKTLVKSNKDKPVFDKINDAGNWNQRGAFCGMNEIIRRIQRDIPQVKEIDEKEYNVSLQTITKIPASKQEFNESVPIYAFKKGFTDVTGDLMTELELSTVHPYFQLIRNDSEKAKGINCLLLFEDDLYGQFAFARSKETAAVSCFQNALHFDYYYNIFKPDVVILENLEYVVSDAYFNQEDMETEKRNPAVLENFPEFNFIERRDILLENTERSYYEASAVLVPGTSIDKVFISRKLGKVKYAYLITDDKVIDLKDNGRDLLTASIKHGDITKDSKVVLYVLGNNGKSHYDIIPVTEEKQNVATKVSSMKNAVYDKGNNNYSMNNELSGDTFSYVAAQLYDKDITKFLVTLGQTDKVGKVEGGYCHTLPTGDYSLLLRAGSKRSDAWAVFNVHLIKGQSYWIKYNVDDFSDNSAVVSGFSLSKPSEDIE